MTSVKLSTDAKSIRQNRNIYILKHFHCVKHGGQMDISNPKLMKNQRF